MKKDDGITVYSDLQDSGNPKILRRNCHKKKSGIYELDPKKLYIYK